MASWEMASDEPLQPQTALLASDRNEQVYFLIAELISQQHALGYCTYWRKA